jgi:catechol 2,3-dioxygenase-like lactoylglutathione lyase family enzyme
MLASAAMKESSESPSWLGLRHLALRVKNLSRSRLFYETCLGMKVVWAPDPQNIYLSSGPDNLALHEVPEGTNLYTGPDHPLDHFGFMVRRKEDVDFIAQQMEQTGAPIAQKVRLHRDGSYSFYMNDPDGNRIQVLYEPRLTEAMNTP